jgi:polyhydroxyalkanoate synthesis repressor PhaR
MSVIKRYANRKLYDTRAKRYVTLDHLAELVRQGEDLSVLDHASGEDITVLTLAQVIVEQEKKAHGGLPQALLQGLIQASNRALGQLRWALPWAGSRPSSFELELKQRIETLVERGQLTEVEGARLAAQFAAAGGAPMPTAETPDAALLALLHERGVPTREDVQALADQLDTVAGRLDGLLRRAEQEAPPITTEVEN